MPLAPRIKPRPASRAPRLAIQILPNRHLQPASPTQNRPLLPLPSRPNRNRMPRQRNMAILASIVDPATPHLDRHNIHRRAVMHASRLPINLDPAHLWTLFSENSELPSVTGGPRPSLCLLCPLCLCGQSMAFRSCAWVLPGSLQSEAWESIQCLICGSRRLSGTAPCSRTASWKARTLNLAPRRRSASARSSRILSWPSL